jgi:branched-chain amino acid transport system substrate-binding protein
LNYFGKGEFDKAAEKFEQSRKSRADDSEALIYLNNARVANKNPLTIAVSVPIWNAPNVAQEMLRGVAQAQHNVNASTEGINGKPLQVMIVNDGNEPKIAERIADRLVGDSKILAVVGHNSSDVSKKGAVVYQDHLVMITPTSFALDLKNLKEAQAGNYIFRSVYSYEVLVPDLANHIIKTLKTPNLLLCTDSDAYDQRGFGDEFSKYNEIKLTQIDCDLSNPDLDFEQVIEQGIKKGANSLFVAPQVNRIQEAIDLAKIAPGRLKLFGISTLYTMDTLKQDVEGLVLSVYWHPGAFTENKENRTFYETAKHLWGKDINITWRTAMAYDAAEVIIEGLKKIPSSQSPSREGLQKVLSNPEFKIEKATGPIQFSPSGERRDGKAFLMKVCPGKESGAGYDFVPFESSEPCQTQ